MKGLQLYVFLELLQFIVPGESKLRKVLGGFRIEMSSGIREIMELIALLSDTTSSKPSEYSMSLVISRHVNGYQTHVWLDLYIAPGSWVHEVFNEMSRQTYPQNLEEHFAPHIEELTNYYRLKYQIPDITESEIRKEAERAKKQTSRKSATHAMRQTRNRKNQIQDNIRRRKK